MTCNLAPAWVVSSVMLAACATAAADRHEAPLAPAGDPARGREVFASREGGHCVLCHAIPGVSLAGNVGPSLEGVGARLDPGQLRLRIMDISRVNREAAMPAFHRTEGLTRVAPNLAGKPVLAAQQVEDLVAFLGTLR